MNNKYSSETELASEGQDLFMSNLCIFIGYTLAELSNHQQYPLSS